MRSDKHKDVSFYRLPPPNTKMYYQWAIKARISTEDVTENSRICSKHFENGKHDTVPSLFPWSRRARKPPAERPFDVVVRPRVRPPTLNEKRLAIKHDHNYCSKSIDPPSYLTTISSKETINLPIALLHIPFRIEAIMHDNKLVHFYTAFDDYSSLEVCFNFLGDSVHRLHYWYAGKGPAGEARAGARCLTAVNEFFLVLCRLRLGLLEEDLAYRFSISQSTVSRICNTWINFLYHKFKELNIWPSRQQVDQYMPKCFEDYPQTRCIIDATEIFIQQPSSPAAQQLTFSSYKNHNTFKGLVGITPSGAVCFISELYGGNISDKQLTARSGILELFDPGDSVMADKGFAIADLLEPRGVCLNIPPMKMKEQFEENELLETRRIATVRVHVERAIGRLKLFHILSNIPNCMAGLANQIFFISTIFVNFHKPLV